MFSSLKTSVELTLSKCKNVLPDVSFLHCSPVRTSTGETTLKTARHCRSKSYLRKCIHLDSPTSFALSAEQEDENRQSILNFGEQLADYLKKGLADNWSQVLTKQLRDQIFLHLSFIRPSEIVPPTPSSLLFGHSTGTGRGTGSLPVED